ncbi:MAG: YceD family protein [Acidimicrobiia bacterium]
MTVLRVPVADLRHHRGTQRPLRVAAALPGLEISAAAVPDDAEVIVDLVLEATTDGSLTATGTVVAPFRGQCRRCLGPVSGTVETDVREVYDRDPVDEEIYPLDGDEADLEPMVRDAVLLALPLAPLCAETCPGPDPEGHPLTGAGGAVPDADPRWAALGDVEFD